MSRTPKMSRLPRWMHRVWARLTGYFWSPCPLCRQMFGGHEWRSLPGLSSTVYFDKDGNLYQPTADIVPRGVRGKGICPRCTREGKGTWYTRRSPDGS